MTCDPIFKINPPPDIEPIDAPPQTWWEKLVAWLLRRDPPDQEYRLRSGWLE